MSWFTQKKAGDSQEPKKRQISRKQQSGRLKSNHINNYVLILSTAYKCSNKLISGGGEGTTWLNFLLDFLGFTYQSLLTCSEPVRYYSSNLPCLPAFSKHMSNKISQINIHFFLPLLSNFLVIAAHSYFCNTTQFFINAILQLLLLHADNILLNLIFHMTQKDSYQPGNPKVHDIQEYILLGRHRYSHETARPEAGELRVCRLLEVSASTGPQQTLPEGQEDTENQSGTNRSRAGRKQPPGTSHQHTVCNACHIWLHSLTCEEQNVEGRGTHNDLNSFNKIKTLALTLGPTLPNNHQIPQARGNEQAKGKS